MKGKSWPSSEYDWKDHPVHDRRGELLKKPQEDQEIKQGELLGQWMRVTEKTLK